ncbi:unnamed protein product [Rhodiola kirilowii]
MVVADHWIWGMVVADHRNGGIGKKKKMRRGFEKEKENEKGKGICLDMGMYVILSGIITFTLFGYIYLCLLAFFSSCLDIGHGQAQSFIIFVMLGHLTWAKLNM